MRLLNLVVGLVLAAAEYRPTMDGLQRCSGITDKFNVPRTGLKTPREIVDMGKITTFRPRSDWVIVHDFYFPENESHAIVSFEMGKGYGGSYALSQMCVEAGAPGGCPDLRSAFGSSHDWTDPVVQQQFISIYNSTLDPRCNTPGVPFPTYLHFEDICLHDKTDDDYWYVLVMIDLEFAKICQGGVPSCRMAQIGKPGGRDPHFWAESWDTWGALAFNDTHIERMAWSECPTEMTGMAATPCNFGSVPGGSNCDRYFSPNVAPSKRNPPEPWPPLKDGVPLVGNPDGLAVEGYFCANTRGAGCEYSGYIPELPRLSRHPAAPPPPYTTPWSGNRIPPPPSPAFMPTSAALLSLPDCAAVDVFVPGTALAVQVPLELIGTHRQYTVTTYSGDGYAPTGFTWGNTFADVTTMVTIAGQASLRAAAGGYPLRFSSCDVVGTQTFRTVVHGMCRDRANEDTNTYAVRIIADQQLRSCTHPGYGFCRIIKIGKPNGATPLVYSESHDGPAGAVAVQGDETLLKWSSCPTSFVDGAPPQFSVTAVSATFIDNPAPPPPPPTPTYLTKYCGIQSSTGNEIWVPQSIDCKKIVPKLVHCDLECKVAWGLAWPALTGILACALLYYLRTAAPKAKEPYDNTILYLYCTSLFFETVAFAAQTLALYLYAEWRWDDYTTAIDTVSVAQITNGVFIWTVAVMLYRYDRKTNVFSIFKYTASIGGAFAVLYIILAFYGSDAKAVVFLAWFEPVFWLRIGSALVIAGNVPRSHNWAIVFVITKFILVIFHLYSIAIEIDEDYERDWSFPITRLVHILLEPVATLALVQLVRLGTFTPQPPKYKHLTTFDAATVMLREKELAKVNEEKELTWRTHFVYPERLWQYGAAGMVTGYFASGILLFGVTKPVVARDPIYNMYSTFHTCMLLDYLPGAFAAYVFFGWLVLNQQACALATFVRTALSGSAFLTVTTAASSLFLYFACAAFPLVFVLSPAGTTVLAHSVPYMLHQAGIAAFMFVGIFHVAALSSKVKTITWRQRLHYIIFACVYVLVVTYGLAFMFTTILESFGLGDNVGKERRGANIAMESYADRDGSTSLMEKMPSCDGVDSATLDKAHPWAYIPSELVGTVRVFTAVNDTSPSSSFMQLNNMTIDGYGLSSVSTTVLTQGAATAAAAVAAALSGQTMFTPAPACDTIGDHVFVHRIYAMCRARLFETADWYVLHAMSADEIEQDCTGAGDALLESAPAKFRSGHAKGGCTQLMLGKADGQYSNQLRESAAVPDAMVNDTGVVHLRWSVCPNHMLLSPDATALPTGSVPDMTAQRSWTFIDGEIEIMAEILPLLATLLIVVFLVTYPKVHPLRNTPLAMEVTSYEAYAGKPKDDSTGPIVKNPATLEWDTKSTFFAVFTPRALFRVGVFLLVIAAIVGAYLDGAVLGSHFVEDTPLRELLRTQPGSSAVATLYTIFAGLTLFSVLLEVYHQHHNNEIYGIRIAGYFVSAFMAVGLLIGPTSLVPGAHEYWSDFYGVQMLQLALIFWLIWQCALLWQTGRAGARAVVETVVAGVTGILLLVSMISSGDAMLDAAFIVGLLVWSVLDSRRLTFHFVNIRISDDADMNLAMRRDKVSPSMRQFVCCGFLSLCSGKRPDGKDMDDEDEDEEKSESKLSRAMAIAVKMADKEAEGDLPDVGAVTSTSMLLDEEDGGESIEAEEAIAVPSTSTEPTYSTGLLEEITALKKALDSADGALDPASRDRLAARLEEKKMAFRASASLRV